MDIFSPIKKCVLIVDDDVINLMQLAALLRDHYQVNIARNSEHALASAQRIQPDLILLDLMLPNMNGYSLCAMLKSNQTTCAIPVIFLTSQTDVLDEEHGLNMGGVDYITRPVRAGILLSRVRAHIADSATERTARISNEYLEYALKKRTEQLTAMQDVTILAMASLSETRDTDTGNHLRRTQQYVSLLAQHMKTKPGYADYLTKTAIDTLDRCAPLHDIGKVGIPDRILLKPGKYTQEEYAIMKRHPTLGRDTLFNAQCAAGPASQEIDGPGDFFQIAKELVYSHHEKWDGSGYPDGLTGIEIPIPARLMSIADVYDALISKRVYRLAMPEEKVIATIREGRGSFFAPELVDAFLELSHEFSKVALRFADTEIELAEKAELSASALDLVDT